MFILIGIDDTDNLDTRGTGYQARQLGFSLMDAGLLKLHSITRHQLLADRRIPFTSHNSSACLAGETGATVEALAEHCSAFLLRESAFDSDAGLCIAGMDRVMPEIVAFGERAKREILTLEEAQGLAKRHSIFLNGYINTKLGMIGSLAGVGLRAGGNDGRLLWTNNLRETKGIYSTADYLGLTGIQRIIDKEGIQLKPENRVNISEWCRPVMKDGWITLIVDKANNHEYEYISSSKEYIKSISE